MNVPVLVAAVAIALLASTTIVEVQTADSKAKASAIRAGATPTQLICAFHPPEYATSKQKLCGTGDTQ